MIASTGIFTTSQPIMIALKTPKVALDGGYFDELPITIFLSSARKVVSQAYIATLRLKIR
jgi:hypothetical protein